MPERDFELSLERHRREVHVHCYRMLGSFTDAEDVVQETFLRAWRHRDDHQPGTGLRPWLYRIATNACIDVIRKRRRRVPATGSGAEVTWLQPYPDLLLEEMPAGGESPETAIVARETIELAFVTAVQALPERQRAVVALCIAGDWSTGETAAALGMTPTAVNSALQRARATLRGRLPQDRSTWTAPALSADEREVLRRFIEAHERGDANAARALMSDDYVVTMPPDPQTYRGLAAVEPMFRLAFGPDGMGDWRLVPVGANRQPAAASYLRRPGDSIYRAFKIDVLRVAGGKLAEGTVFDAALFPAFGLAEVWTPQGGIPTTPAEGG